MTYIKVINHKKKINENNISSILTLNFIGINSIKDNTKEIIISI